MKRILIVAVLLIMGVMLVGASEWQVLVFPAGNQIDTWRYWEQDHLSVTMESDLFGYPIAYPDGVRDALSGVPNEAGYTLIWLDLAAQSNDECIWVAWNNYDPLLNVFILIDDEPCVSGDFHQNSGAYIVSWEDFTSSSLYDLFCQEKAYRCD